MRIRKILSTENSAGPWIRREIRLSYGSPLTDSFEFENFSKKLWGKSFSPYLCTPAKGSIAQLVQSICLTSRGSAVRTRVLPQMQKEVIAKVIAFFILQLPG